LLIKKENAKKRLENIGDITKICKDDKVCAEIISIYNKLHKLIHSPLSKLDFHIKF
jgi:hypothetical protein